MLILQLQPEFTILMIIVAVIFLIIAFLTKKDDGDNK